MRDFVLGAIVRPGRHEGRDGQREEEEGGCVHGHAVVSRGGRGLVLREGMKTFKRVSGEETERQGRREGLSTISWNRGRRVTRTSGRCGCKRM